jgi:hypothetical protein
VVGSDELAVRGRGAGERREGRIVAGGVSWLADCVQRGRGGEGVGGGGGVVWYKLTFEDYNRRRRRVSMEWVAAARLNKVVHSSVHRAACPVSRRTFGPSVASTQMCLASFLFKFGSGNPSTSGHRRRRILRPTKPCANLDLQQARQHHASAALGLRGQAPLHCTATAPQTSIRQQQHTRARCTRSQAPHRRSVPCVRAAAKQRLD